MNAMSVSALGLVLTIYGTLQYLLTIPRHQVPVRPVFFISCLTLGVVLALASLAGLPPRFNLLALVHIALAVVTLVIALGMLWLLLNRKTPLGDIKVTEGSPLLPFQSMTSGGQAFSTDELAGKRVLLKFFRGAWCPYCSAELQSFDGMQAFFEQYGVSVYALSKDTVDEARIHKQRDQLSLTLLADESLRVIRQYGVEHHKAIGGKTNGFSLLGIPLSVPYKFSSMAIPTTLLIDEHGIIRWIDQSDDYRIRSNEDRVKAAVRSAFDPDLKNEKN